MINIAYSYKVTTVLQHFLTRLNSLINRDNLIVDVCQVGSA